jgi:hypothetical protein
MTSTRTKNTPDPKVYIQTACRNMEYGRLYFQMRVPQLRPSPLPSPLEHARDVLTLKEDFWTFTATPVEIEGHRMYEIKCNDEVIGRVPDGAIRNA